VPVRDLTALGHQRRQDELSQTARARIVETAARLAREKLAPRAARYDRDAANPVDSWRDLHADGILAAAIPVAHGGLGLDMTAYVDVIRTLAQGCASTAMTLHMHSTMMRSSTYWAPRRRSGAGSPRSWAAASCSARGVASRR
jgi:alkylation response protein AidB-like acyl-CoA dehydrogenase